MDNSLPARPSLEQLRKLAKDLVKSHQKKNPEALALIRRHLLEAVRKTEREIAESAFALHDAQSVVARQHGFVSWNELTAAVGAQGGIEPAPQMPELVANRLRITLEAQEKRDYELWCSVMSPEMKAAMPKERWEAASDRLSARFNSGDRLTYMGALNRGGCPVHFWRLQVQGRESDVLVRMSLNPAGLVAGMLYSDPFDTGIGRKS
jgi:hypothetical protein